MCSYRSGVEDIGVYGAGFRAEGVGFMSDAMETWQGGFYTGSSDGLAQNPKHSTVHRIYKKRLSRKR